MILIILATPKPRCVDYIKIDLEVIDLESADWINMAEGREGWYFFRECGSETLSFTRCEQFYD
jgi:hypothetical protein